MLVRGIEALGLRMHVAQGHRSWTLTQSGCAARDGLREGSQRLIDEQEL